MLKKLSYIFYRIIRFSDKFFYLITKKNFLFSFKDFIEEDSYKSIKILDKIEFKILNNIELQKELKNNNTFLYLKIRKEAFLNTIYNKKPWEDISIGFQMRQFRKPNVYNNNFWFHFTNKYVSKKYGYIE